MRLFFLILVACWGLSAQGFAAEPPVGKLAAGYFHSCALVAGGQVKCWGLGEQGQLGNGRFQSSAQPQTVKGLSQVREIASGYHWSCARLANGTLRCWGAIEAAWASPAERKLVKTCKATATITYPCVSTPVAVSGISKVKTLASSAKHLFAIQENGLVYAIYMDKPQADAPAIQRLDWLKDVRSISSIKASSNHTSGCALNQQGQVSCWNSNALYGDYKPICARREAQCQLEVEGNLLGLAGEDAPKFCQAVAQRQPDQLSLKRFACGPQQGNTQTCTYVDSNLAEATHLQALFLNGSSAQVYYPERIFDEPEHPSNCRIPYTRELDRLPVEGLQNMRAIAVNGSEGAYALRQDGTAFFWGQTTLAAAFLPAPKEAQGAVDPGGHPLQQVPLLKGALQIDENGKTGCALWPQAEVRCWGMQLNRGLVGNGSATGFVSQPVKLQLPPVLALSKGDYHSCALVAGGKVYCWGDNEDGKLGSGVKGKFSALPREIPGLKLAL